MIDAKGRYYEDLVIGEVRESSARTLSLEELLEFASRYDPQYFHADPIAARHSIFGGVIASGIHSAAIWRALDHEISGLLGCPRASGLLGAPLRSQPRKNKAGNE